MLLLVNVVGAGAFAVSHGLVARSCRYVSTSSGVMSVMSATNSSGAIEGSHSCSLHSGCPSSRSISRIRSVGASKDKKGVECRENLHQLFSCQSEWKSLWQNSPLAALIIALIWYFSCRRAKNRSLKPSRIDTKLSSSIAICRRFFSALTRCDSGTCATRDFQLQSYLSARRSM